jgi:hypothetical protein
MRGKKVEGSSRSIFVVDPTGKVSNRASRSPRIPPSSAPRSTRSAVEVRAAVKAGQRVACKMRVPIRFQPS